MFLLRLVVSPKLEIIIGKTENIYKIYLRIHQIKIKANNDDVTSIIKEHLSS